MGPEYTGCQNSWIDLNGKWELFSRLYFEGGKFRVKWSQSDDDPPKDIYCFYDDFKVQAGSAKDCYELARSSVPSPSFAPGCMEHAIKTGEITRDCGKSLDR